MSEDALDYAFEEWINKPVAFVGYGAVGGARAVEHLRLSAIELQMAPIRSAVHIQVPVYLAVLEEGKQLGEFDFLNQSAKDMLDQLAWWTDALKVAREQAELALPNCLERPRKGAHDPKREMAQTTTPRPFGRTFPIRHGARRPPPCTSGPRSWARSASR